MAVNMQNSNATALQALMGGGGGGMASAAAGATPYGAIAQMAGQGIGMGANIVADQISDPKQSAIVRGVGEGLASGGIFGPALGLYKGIQAGREAEKQLSLQSMQRGQAINAAAYQSGTNPQLRMGGELHHIGGRKHENGGTKMLGVEVERGETMMDNYVYSDFLQPNGEKNTFAVKSKIIDSKYPRKYDPFSMGSKAMEFSHLRNEQEEVKEEIRKCGGKIKMKGQKMVNGGDLDTFQLGGYIGTDAMDVFMSAEGGRKMQTGGSIEPILEPNFLQRVQENPTSFGPGTTGDLIPLADVTTDYYNNGKLRSNVTEVQDRGVWKNVHGKDFQKRLREAGLNVTRGNVNAFEAYLDRTGQLPKFDSDQKWGREHDRAFQQSLSGFLGSPEYKAVNSVPSSELKKGANPYALDLATKVATTPTEATNTEQKELQDTYNGVINEGRYRGPNALLTGLPNALQALGTNYLANQVNYSRVRPYTYDPQLLDPTRALQNVGTAFSGANQAIADTARGGTALTNRLVSAAAEAGSRADVATEYEARNVGIMNQAEAANAAARARASAINADIQRQELDTTLSLKGRALSQAAQAGVNIMDQLNLNARTRYAIPFSGTADYRNTVDERGNVIQVADTNVGGKRRRSLAVGALGRGNMFSGFKQARADQPVGRSANITLNQVPALNPTTTAQGGGLPNYDFFAPDREAQLNYFLNE